MNTGTTGTQLPITVSSPLRVLLWAPGGAGLHYSGPGMSAYRLYSSDQDGRFRVSLAHGISDHAEYGLFENQTLIHPLRGSAWDQIAFIRKGTKWVKEQAGRYDVLHGLQGFNLTVNPAFQAITSGLPAVVKLAAHRSDLTNKPGLKSWLGLAALRRRRLHSMDAIIAISTAIRDELLEYGFAEEKIAFIPNGVDTRRFFPVQSQAERLEAKKALQIRNCPTILFVGGVNSRKRPHFLVEAIGEISRCIGDCQLILLGPTKSGGEYARQLKCRVRELGLGDKVIWVEFVQDPAPFYRAADVFCLPSSNEGLPNALLEAMACGLPCIGTATSGIDDLLIHEKTGIIASESASAIAEAAKHLLQDHRTAGALGAGALGLIRAQYSAEVVLDAHWNLFQRIILR